MKTLTKEELNTILESHRLWLKTRWTEAPEGERADLSYTDLSEANLRNADLRGAKLVYSNLSSANLINADLSGACLVRANLNYANLTGVKLNGADLTEVNLTHADLNHSQLISATFARANLTRANLKGANLNDADLRDSNLRETDLRGANLIASNLSRANLSHTNLDEKERIRFGTILKEDMTGYKICYLSKIDEPFKIAIVELLIPKGAVVLSINNNKCRTNKAKVMSIKEFVYKENYPEAYSMYNRNFIYEVGQEIEIEDFNCQYNIECESGIHFFRTAKEARNADLL